MRNSLAGILLLLTVLGFCGCRGSSSSTQAADSTEISEADVTAYVDWHNEFQATVFRETETAMEILNRSGEKAYNDYMNSVRPKIAALNAKKPFGGTVKGQALDQLMQCFFLSQRYFRDDKQLEVLKQKYGSLIETGAEHEAAWQRLKIGKP